ncbi:hypothetical protein RJ639_004597 [Escallonia herrerae]|uniref:Uncharacterized protein n=1 Tax=Escallonia herrerae TaxID=1293975 RepID=A0AA88W2H5_9ASTE|nr:hypothetical protein RJ639_004597 [Escallonia herrerae]
MHGNGRGKGKTAGVWPTVKPFVNGGASGMLATCVIQPIDMIKVRIQLGQGSAGQVMRTMLKNEGIRAFYKSSHFGVALGTRLSALRLIQKGYKLNFDENYCMIINKKNDQVIATIRMALNKKSELFSKFLEFKAYVEQAYGLTDAKKIELIVYKLDEEVSHWWKMIEDSKMAEQRKAMTWDQFKDLFFDYYFPRSEDNKSVAEYEVQVLFVRGATSNMVVKVTFGIREHVSDIIILTHFIRGSPLNITGIIMLVMNARKNKSSANLPLGLLLTRVFEHFHVPLPTSNSERISLPGHHVHDETSLCRAGFVIRSDLSSNTVFLERVTTTDPSHTSSILAPAPAFIHVPSPPPEITSAPQSDPFPSFSPSQPPSTQYIPPAPTDPSSSVLPFPTPPHPTDPLFSSLLNDFSHINFDEFLSSDTPDLSDIISRLSTSIQLILESQTTLVAPITANHTAIIHELAAL